MMGYLYLHRQMFIGTLLVVALLPTTTAAELYHIPDADPGSYESIQDVVKPGSGEIPKNLEEAMCGGWDLGTDLNGMFGREEPVCPPSAEEPLGARCADTRGVEWIKVEENIWEDVIGGQQSDIDMDANAMRTNPDRGLIANVKGVPGRENQQALGNVRSGMALRTEEGGDQDLAGHPPQYTGTTSGFVYPKDTNTVCGFSTVCRTSDHPDRRARPSVVTDPDYRDGPPFFCAHPCQRPLDNPGKPGNWDPNDSDAVDCGSQQPYAPEEDQIRYACGGGETKGPEQGFCQELQENGPLGGLCQDINTYIYILWQKKEGECFSKTDGSYLGPIMLYEKGKCGFPPETEEERPEREAVEFSEEGKYECCSDDPFNPGGHGQSCIVCTGNDCRKNPRTNTVIINDAWVSVGDKFGPFPNDVCQGADHMSEHRRADEDRAYISYFRDYNDASYERAPLQQSGVQPDGSQKTLARNDDHKKEHIPVACYGLYDMSPEDVKYVASRPRDKHCTIGAYYDAVNFWEMKDSQKGRGFFVEELPANPFNDPLRPFDKEKTLWFPELGSAFSLINDKVFKDKMDSNLTFTILAPDSAEQRATVQIDKDRPISSGSLLRAFDDTVTNELDIRKDRRSVTEWWQAVETEMHEFFSPPIIRLLLATTWSIDLDPLDPIYTPPVPPSPEDEAVDPRSESIEVQIEAREDLLGDIIAYMERARLLRVEGEPIPIVVPIGNPTELRAIAHGWEVWAEKQANSTPPGPGVSEANEVAEKLLNYADRVDNVRKIRTQLPRYAGALLEQQKIVTRKLAEWLTQNIDAYDEYVSLEIQTQLAEQKWKAIQDRYRKMHNKEAFPWCRNDRFTTPIYSLLDPWMPDSESLNPNPSPRASDPNAIFPRDPTGGYLEQVNCMQEIVDIDIAQCDNVEFDFLCFNSVAPSCSAAIFDRYAYCVNLFASRRKEDGEEYWPTLEVCNEYLPMAPNLPFEESDRDPDLVLDFTAFREPPKTIKLPVLKPTQIRMDFSQIRPPALENNKMPTFFPELPDLPELPEEITQQVFDSLPGAMVFTEAPVLTIGDDNTVDPDIPQIHIPQTDTTLVVSLLEDIEELINEMSDEYSKFWESMTLEKCEGGRGDDCIAPGTEQDCVEPYNDPKKRCVHFEGDLKERLQRIGSRPAILIKDDYKSIGTFRNPIMHGQENCERTDWACQLLNARNRKPREGWLVDISDEYDPETMMLEIREALREQTSNIVDSPEDMFPYDVPQDQIFEIFRLPEGERIDRRIESIENTSPDES